MNGNGPAIIQLEVGKLVDKYTVVRKLGEGTFGAVYAVQDAKGNKYALKAESVNERVPLLRLELLVMQRLQEKHAMHMADLIDKGRFENFNYIIMKLLGKSLQVAKKTGPDQHLSLGPAIGCAIQCLEALEELHWIGFLHRSGNNVMLQPRKKAPFRGTPRFYMLVDFTNAKLPWKGTTDIKDVGKIKIESRQEPLLSEMMMLCPMEEYKLVLDHIDGLSFFDEPKYDLIYSTLRGAMKRKGVSEFPYDWEKEAVSS
ncbi:hypothetical protein ANCCAN_20159 [Ancylostoma caninum]|uniref:Protein kinase domain-containing protein n=1 Tax=Ancylostoma caninum TaxID=29170 RepID=A0A368FP52_ANCCA|nr:hypothetical protein ANCCAN_20159 [Ancylostoma caninum]